MSDIVMSDLPFDVLTQIIRNVWMKGEFLVLWREARQNPVFKHKLRKIVIDNILRDKALIRNSELSYYHMVYDIDDFPIQVAWLETDYEQYLANEQAKERLKSFVVEDLVNIISSNAEKLFLKYAAEGEIKKIMYLDQNFEISDIAWACAHVGLRKQNVFEFLNNARKLSSYYKLLIIQAHQRVHSPINSNIKAIFDSISSNDIFEFLVGRLKRREQALLGETLKRKRDNGQISDSTEFDSEEGEDL